MKYAALKNFYTEKNLNDEYNNALLSITNLELYLIKENSTIDNCTIENLENYMEILIKESRNDLKTISALARYFYFSNQKDIYIFFTTILGGIGVFENIMETANKAIGKNMTDDIFKDKLFPLGTVTKKTIFYTRDLMNDLINNLDSNIYQNILAKNNHSISAESMFEEKKYYKKAESLEIYLKERHERKVSELQRYCDENKIWYEQKITQKIIDYVKNNQEILSAKLIDNKLYVTKFPYNPEKFLNTNLELEKKYQYCHCTFARESIKNKDVNIHKDWCYCSAGFAKFPFEVILERELKVTVLESVLDGNDKCRFCIYLD